MSDLMKNILTTTAILGIILLGPARLTAQTPQEFEALRKDIQALKDAQATTQKQLQEILQLLRGLQPQAPPAAPAMATSVGAAGAPVKGSPNAPLTVVEFSDYECPFCGRHVTQTLPKLAAEYMDSGKVKFVFRDFPLEQIHPSALKAAEAARCAGEQGKYWEMHDRLFANQRALAAAQLTEHATAIGLDAPAFDKCLTSGSQTAKVRKDLADGKAAGVTGTPAFFIGVMDNKAGTVKVLRTITGARPYEAFKATIDELLAQVNK
jgi:protein-disulfide isomerase